LLLQDADSAAELAARLQTWRGEPSMAQRAAAFGNELRARSWDDMGRDIASLVEGGARA
jgi:hypothetical protein